MKICQQLKTLNPLVVYATDHSKVVVLVLFSFCVALWAFHVESCLTHCYLLVALLGEERAGLFYVLLLHLFVYLAHSNFCPFSLPLVVRSWLMAMACDFGTPWTFLFTILLYH